MKIVEISPYAKIDFRIGDCVVAYDINLRTDKYQKFDYHAIVVGLSDDKVTVQYQDHRTLEVNRTYVFVPGTERTCEIWKGSLFDYPGAWDADMCILETDFPIEMHKELITSMSKTPIGCTFLTYHDLKKLDEFKPDEFRQLDVNIYDSDRYLTSWSQGWRFYCWEHVVDHSKPQSLPLNITPQSLMKEERIRVYNRWKKRWSWARVRAVRKNRVKVVFIDEMRKDSFDIRDYRLALHRPRFGVGALVSVYHPKWAYQMQFFIIRGEVINHHADGSYGVKWESDEGFKTIAVPENYVFARIKSRYHVGQAVRCCWTEYALNKNSPWRYKKYKAVVKNVNEDGTYAVEFNFGEDDIRCSEIVREMWITTEEEENQKLITVEQWDEDPINSLCIKVARQWTPRCVATYLLECSNEEGLSHSEKLSIANAGQLALNMNIGGEEFIKMSEEQLGMELGFSRSLAKYFYKRFMYWIHIRMDSPPE